MKNIFKKIFGSSDKNKSNQALNNNKLSSQLIEFYELSEEDQVFEVADRLKEVPIVVNFEGLDAKKANKLLGFLSGISYVYDGKIIKLQSLIYLFGKNSDFEDNSLEAFVEKYRQGD